MRNLIPLLFLLTACQSAKIAPAATVPELVATALKPKPNWKPPALRLGDAARPTHYVARLKIIPTDETFTGSIDIELVLKQPLSILWLNGSELVVSQASLESGGKSVRADPVPGGESFLGFAFESTVPAGNAKLHVQYTAGFPVATTMESSGAKTMASGTWRINSSRSPPDSPFPVSTSPRSRCPGS